MTTPVQYVVSPLRRALVSFHVTVAIPVACSLVGFALVQYWSFHRAGYGPGSVATPWSLYAIGAVGGLMLYAGLSRTTRSFVLSLGSQATLVILYLLFGRDADVASKDPSGTLVILNDFVETHGPLVGSFAVVMFAVQSLAIAVSLWESALVRRAFEEADAAEAAVLEAVARRAYEPISASAWNERLREKYGVDVRSAYGVDGAGAGLGGTDEELGEPLLAVEDEEE